MRHINFFKSFSANKLCKQYNIKNYIINKDGSIDVDGDVILDNRRLTELPLKFNNVSGSFYCEENFLTSLESSPVNVGSFYCDDNSLSSLKGCPKNVKFNFCCSNNILKTLEGSPEHIKGGLNCQNNQIATFEGFPKHIGDYFLCDGNPIWYIWRLFEDITKIELFNDMDIIRDGVIILDRLNYFLEEIGKKTIKSKYVVHGYKVRHQMSAKLIIYLFFSHFLGIFVHMKQESINKICEQMGIRNYTINNDGSINVYNSVHLSHMKLSKLPLLFNKIGGYKEEEDESFACGNNQLTSLKGCPKYVNGYFNCAGNNLTSLKGCPETVNGNFYCSFNRITTFEYFPKYIKGRFHCNNNPIYEIWRLFEDTTKIELFNDMDIIQDDTVILDRLNYFLEEIGKPAYHNLEEIGKPPYSDIAYHNYVFKLKYISEYKYI